VVRNREI